MLLIQKKYQTKKILLIIKIKNNTLYKNFTSNSNNLSSQNSKQKIDNNLKSFKDNKKIQMKKEKI